MNENQRAAYIISQSVCAMIEAMGMAAENQLKKHQEEAPIYLKYDFDELLVRYGIHHNAVYEMIRS